MISNNLGSVVLQGLGVLATFLAVAAALCIAIYGEKWRAKLNPAKLRLALDVPLGKRMLAADSVPCRWFCVRVTNENRTRNATDVRLLMLKVELLNNNPAVFPDWEWSGEVPMQRSHPEIYTTPPVVGPAALFDVFTVYKNHRVQLHPVLAPNDLQREWSTPTHLKLTMQARSNEADSPIYSVRIVWNGAWAQGDSEMAKHLDIVEELLG